MIVLICPKCDSDNIRITEYSTFICQDCGEDVEPGDNCGFQHRNSK